MLARDRSSPPPGRSSTASSAGARRRALGRMGEEVAAEHFRERGFAVLARNARTRHGEIDLIACDGEVIVFAEIKTRSTRASMGRPRAHLEPLAGLRARQRVRLRRLAAAWLADPDNARPRARTIRFDAIGVFIHSATGRPVRLDHVEEAW